MQHEPRSQVVSTRLSMDIINKMNGVVGDGNKSDFILQAIENELAHSHDSGKEYREMTKKINKIDADSLHKSLSELIVTTQVIFEELRKQNELLKLIHRRATFSSVFSKHGLDEIKRSDELSKSVKLKAVELTQDELKQLKF